MKYVKKNDVLNKLDELLSTVNAIEKNCVNRVVETVNDIEEEINLCIENVEEELNKLEKRPYKMIS